MFPCVFTSDTKSASSHRRTVEKHVDDVELGEEQGFD